MFTYRDFEMGTLGLAWTGDLKNAGGVCEKNGVSTQQHKIKILSINFVRLAFTDPSSHGIFPMLVEKLNKISV